MAQTTAEKIHAAVLALRDDDESHWTDNKPSIRAVEELSGVTGIDRKYLNHFSRFRKAAPTPKAVASEAPKISEAQAAAALHTAEQQLAQAKERAALAQRNVKTARGNLGYAATEWVKLFSISRLDNVRAFQRTSVAARARVAAGGVVPAAPRVANSQIDRMNVGARLRGYGPGFRRGAYPASMLGRMVAPKE